MVALPAATDIYLTGAKSDDAEIRLARFMIDTLQPGDFFIDVGSHFGYFARLALKCMSGNGIILAIEPAKETFDILKTNLEEHPSATLLHCLAGEKDSRKDFYEFPIEQSEYNTAFPEQFKEQGWYKKVQLKKHSISCRSLDSLLASYERTPTLIKIDTEGSELEVIKGAMKLISGCKDLVIVMEILSKSRKNEAHLKAVELLKQSGYYPHTITFEGELKACTDIEDHLSVNNIDSDNIAFKYNAPANAGQHLSQTKYKKSVE